MPPWPSHPPHLGLHPSLRHPLPRPLPTAHLFAQGSRPAPWWGPPRGHSNRANIPESHATLCTRTPEALKRPPRPACSPEALCCQCTGVTAGMPPGAQAHEYTRTVLECPPPHGVQVAGEAIAGSGCCCCHQGRMVPPGAPELSQGSEGVPTPAAGPRWATLGRGGRHSPANWATRPGIF